MSVLSQISITEQPLEGRARFESVVRTDPLNHAGLSWRALQDQIFYYRELPERPSGRAGATINIR
eukprot:6194818-Pleurochrysis_carterae.AAC.6